MTRRTWLATLVLVGGCIEVPPFAGTPDGSPDADTPTDAPDAPGSDCTPVGPVVSVFAFAEPPAGGTKLVDVPYDAIVRDRSCAFDGTRFTSPALGHYLVCAGLSSTPEGMFSLSAHTEGADRRIASGTGVIAGCVALSLAPSEELTIRIEGQQAGTLATVTSASWLTIDLIENGGQSAAARGLTSNLIEVATPIDLDPIENWNGTATTVGGGPHLVCASLDFPQNATMRAYVDAVAYDLDNTLAGITIGCRVITTQKGQQLTLRSTGSTMIAPTDRPTENWLAVEKLANTEWSVRAQGTPDVIMTPSGTSPLPFGPVAVTGGELEEAIFTPITPIGGESLVCVNLTVTPPANIALEVVNGALAIEIARGSGALHGCTVVSTSLNESISVRARDLTSKLGTIAADPGATLTIHKIH